VGIHGERFFVDGPGFFFRRASIVTGMQAQGGGGKSDAECFQENFLTSIEIFTIDR
jgi:hypothetical protein